jgi:DNA-binding HxlR family transcriptional regulator
MQLYGQYCPVARAAEILADRWTLLIVRELLADVDHFNELERGLPGISRSLLSDRLRLLVETGVAQRRAAERGRKVEYRLTPAGRDLQRVIDTLGDWGAQWAFGDPRPTELEPIVLLWWMRRRVCHNKINQRRVIQFDFHGLQRSYWLLIDPSEASVCLQHPGFDIDVIVRADIAQFYRVWLGRSTLAHAIGNGHVLLEGAPSVLRAFPGWLQLSPMAGRVSTVVERQQAPAQV